MWSCGLFWGFSLTEGRRRGSRAFKGVGTVTDAVKGGRSGFRFVMCPYGAVFIFRLLASKNDGSGLSGQEKSRSVASYEIDWN